MVGEGHFSTTPKSRTDCPANVEIFRAENPRGVHQRFSFINNTNSSLYSGLFALPEVKELECMVCGKEFKNARGNQRCCSKECSKINEVRYDKARHARDKLEKPKVKKICPTCGLEFETTVDKQIYCSCRCKATDEGNKLIQKQCPQCGKDFKGKRGSLCCSEECKKERLNLFGKYAHVCAKCGKEFRNSQKDSKYCSVACTTKYRSTCQNCGKEFTGQKDRVNKFCSRKCFCEFLGFKDADTPKFRSIVGDSQHIKKAKRLGVEYEHIDILEIFERDNWVCTICNEKIDKHLYYPNPMSASLDHKIPFSRGGTHTRGNVRATHLRCNIIKRDKPTKVAI